MNNKTEKHEIAWKHEIRGSKSDCVAGIYTGNHIKNRELKVKELGKGKYPRLFRICLLS